MKTTQQVSSDKLRGGFYTPESMVDVCLDQISQLIGDRQSLDVLEPSAGDGAFLRRLAVHRLGMQTKQFLGIELNEAEAQKCAEVAFDAPFCAEIIASSVLEWAASSDATFDVVIGNPPFVRYQFLSSRDLVAIGRLSRRLGLPFRGVGNLWIPILLGALSRLRPYGAMAFVVPAELFTGLSAGTVRSWLLANFEHLRVDMFEPGMFPGVLQETVIISGIRRGSSRNGQTLTQITFAEHVGHDSSPTWNHTVSISSDNWTRYLLAPRELRLLEEARSTAHVRYLGDVARLEVSIVTGANEFFSVSNEEVEKYQLRSWAEPLLPRIRHASGLIYSGDDHSMTVDSGARAWLLHFGASRPDPLSNPCSARYLTIGEVANLHTRYKTSIREPWYRVPSVWAGELLMSKRSHWFPRLLYNEAGVLTTDTIYRGRMLPLYSGRAHDLVAAFHNSLTLLSAELEGRSFGGGVLELVPTEISRLLVPFPTDMGVELVRLDSMAREMAATEPSQEPLIEETNALLGKRLPGLAGNLMNELETARQTLLRRRLSRN